MIVAIPKDTGGAHGLMQQWPARVLFAVGSSRRHKSAICCEKHFHNKSMAQQAWGLARWTAGSVQGVCKGSLGAGGAAGTRHKPLRSAWFRWTYHAPSLAVHQHIAHSSPLNLLYSSIHEASSAQHILHTACWHPAQQQTSTWPTAANITNIHLACAPPSSTWVR